MATDIVYSLNEINARIDNFRDLIYCLNVLGRLKSDDKIETPKIGQRPWKIRIQDNSLWWWTGFLTRFKRTFLDHQYREDNFEYVQLVKEETRKEFTYLFQYISRYIMRNNKDAIKHWSHPQLLSFSRSPQEDTKDQEQPPKTPRLDETQWLPMRHMCPPLKKDDKRSFAINYRLCKCIDCCLSAERTAVTRVGELLVQGLASMTNASSGLEYLKAMYDKDDATLERIQNIQTDLNNMIVQYVNMAIYDEDNDCMIRFARPFIDTTSDERQLP